MSKKVLLIDDDEISLMILENAVECEGHQVIVTSNSVIAADLFSEHRPDVVVLDVFMPDKDGFEVIKEIRAISTDVFIIAISATEHYLRTAEGLGASLGILKENMPDDIIEAIKNL
jgi:DNA-binding response OmpR family regulator